MTTINSKCSGCKSYFIPTIKSNGLAYKCCDKCRNRPKCEHNSEKYRCKKCNGNGICEHNRERTKCKDCDGGSICEHNRVKSVCRNCCGISICEHNCEKYRCKKCNGNGICEHNCVKSECRMCGDIIKKTIRRFIHDSRSADKNNNCFDIFNFIDKNFCKLLIESSNNKCCYCDCELELIHYGNNLITIERINNSIGHIKSNVKIACLKCNISRVGDKLI